MTVSAGVDRLRSLIEASQPLLGALVGGFAVVDADGEPIFVSEQARGIWQALAGGAESANYEGFDRAGRRYPPDAWPLRRALATGERIDREQVTVRFESGRSGVVRLSACPVYDSGEILGAVVELVDFTLEARRTAALAFQAEAAELLAASALNVAETLDHLVSLAVPRLADWCSIALVQGGRLQQAAVAHADPGRRRYARELVRRYPSILASPTGVGAVVRTGQPELVSEITDELIDRLIADPELRSIVRELGLYSSMVVPMAAGGQTLGALILVSAEQRHRFDRADLALAEDVAHRAAMAIDTARRFERESAIASALRAAAAPPDLPEIDGVELGVVYRSATEGIDLAGDLYDVWELPGGFGLVIGDVEGKGPTAAAVAALVRHTVRALGRAHESPATVLEIVNDDLRHASLGRFCTAVVAIATRAAECGLTVRVASAGHPPPLVCRAGRTVERVATSGNLLGVYGDLECSDATVELAAGDLLVAYTDGVTERRGGRGVLGDAELAGLVRSAASEQSAMAAARAIETAAAGWAHAPAPDDVAILALKLAPGRNGDQRP